MPKFAFAYLRKSTDRKDKQKFSLETQEREIERAKAVAEAFFGETVEIKETFIEKISGTSRERPLFDAMLAKFDNQEADILLSWRLDRLSRNPTDAGAVMQAMQDRIIPYVADNTRVYTRKDSGLLMGVLFGQASQESMEIADKSLAGTETLIKNGGIPFKVPFGAKNNPSTSAKIEERIIIDEKEARFAKKMFELRAEGKSFAEISRFLAENGFVTKTGKPFATSTLQQWIKNKFYYGICEWGGYTWKHIYEPIISKKLWDLANNVGRGETPRHHEDYFPLKGWIFSAEQGIELTASIAKGKYVFYHTHANKKHIENVSIREDDIFEIFEQQLKYYSVPESVKSDFMEMVGKSHKERLDTLLKERRHISSEITKNSNIIDGLIDLRIHEELSAEDFSRKQKEYTEKAVQLNEQLQKIVAEDDSILESISNSVELLGNLINYWKNGDRYTKSLIIKMISVELFVDTEKRLYIKENAVFE